VDFRKQPTHPKPVSIRGTEVDIVEEYKYLGVHIDNKMDWTKNTERPSIRKVRVACISYGDSDLSEGQNTVTYFWQEACCRALNNSLFLIAVSQ